MSKAARMIMLNQMAGPLFRELAEGISPFFPDGCLLITGHPDTVSMKEVLPETLTLIEAPAYDRRSMIKRLFSWLKYLLFSSRYILKSRPDDLFLLVSNPPLLGGWFWLLTRFRKRDYLVLVYDIHPDLFVSMKVVTQNNPVVRLWEWVNKKVYKDALKIITLGKYMATRLVDKIPDSHKQPGIVPPWVDVEKIRPLPDKENYLVDEFNSEGRSIVLYSGNMGVSHDIDSMLEAARLLKAETGILFLFIGNGEKWQTAKDFVETHCLDNVRVYPFQDESRLPYTMALSSISLVALDDGAEGMMIPSKVYYYLASGAAVIGICNENNELRDVIEKNNAGLCVFPNHPEELATQIKDLLEDKIRLKQLQKNARNTSLQYSRESGINKFIKILSDEGLIEPQVYR